MKFFRLDLLTVLISLFILNSCKNKDTIGLGLDSSTQLNGSLIDTATIIANTVPEDSLVTSGISKAPLGYFIDPTFGTTESNIAVALNLPGAAAYTIPTGTITIDSAILALKYASGFYGDSVTSRYQVNVYQLGSRILTKNYYNTDSTFRILKGPLVGSRSFFARTHDSIRITHVIAGKPDTLIKVVPQLRIPIDKNFINRILFNAGSSQLASNTVFLNNVKGLFLTLDKTGTTGPGGTMMFGLSDSLRVYYHTVNGSKIDTDAVSLPLGTHMVEIKKKPSATIQTELTSTNSSRDVIYLQGLAGTRVRVKFPYLPNIISTLGSNIVINRAELVITPVPGTTIPYGPQPKLTMYRYDIAHQRAPLEDANTTDPRSPGVATFGGFYSTSLNSYHFIVTAYIQDLMNGKTVDYGTYIAPADPTATATAGAVNISPTAQTAGRTIAVGTDRNSPYRIKLNIIYTKINK